MKSNLYFLAIVLLFSCGEKKKEESHVKIRQHSFEVTDQKAFLNYLPERKTKAIELDYENALDSGFVIPSVRQVPGGLFLLSASVKGNGNKLFYKIYYQNESYKFAEATDEKENPLSAENFYGSWEDSLIGFKPVTAVGENITITDSFRITGNPRNELRCYTDGINERWKRNPRVGKYSAIMVIADQRALDSIPEYISHIDKKSENRFVNPYYFWLYGKGQIIENVAVVTFTDTLKVIAKPDPGAGLFVPNEFFNDEVIKQNQTDNCGNSIPISNKAAFSQFIHYIDESTRFENIPVVMDVLGDNYSKTEYNWNRSFYKRQELISTTPSRAEIPCKTVYSDPETKKLVIHNPATVEGKWRKESVGIVTRHGLTYGKWRVKAKLTELLNKNNVWNGITNAIWLINQSNADWNLRLPCDKDGYMKTYWGGENDERVNRVSYSEIDFEILKTPPYCPDQNFPPVYEKRKSNPFNIKDWNKPLPEEISAHDGDITVACTNWDMACHQPANFASGCNEVKYNDKTFYTHRWSDSYRAITEKTYESDDSLFASEYYYFEIDWQPEQITWRIGPSPDNMRVVGYMDKTVTSIPDNQMLLIVTQEFHNTKWWPGSPYAQENIPFPAKDIKGEILEVVIE